MIIKMLAPEHYYLLEEFCKEEGIEAPSPDFSWVEAAIDMDAGKIVGIVVTQMLIHTEPIWIKKEYQGKGLKERLMDEMELRIDEASALKGAPIHVYAEPTNPASEKICRQRGFTQSERKFWTKVYGGERFIELLKSNIE
jgi:ribosomal protein S18 acetylase RimI-like enzyme